MTLPTRTIERAFTHPVVRLVAVTLLQAAVDRIQRTDGSVPGPCGCRGTSASGR